MSFLKQTYNINVVSTIYGTTTVNKLLRAISTTYLYSGKNDSQLISELTVFNVDETDGGVYYCSYDINEEIVTTAIDICVEGE